MFYLLCYAKGLVREANGTIARHYGGYAKTESTLRARLLHHAQGTSQAKFTAAMYDNGTPFIVTAVYVDAERGEERRIKNQKKYAPYCAACAGQSARPAPYGLKAYSADALAELNEWLADRMGWSNLPAEFFMQAQALEVHYE